MNIPTYIVPEVIAVTVNVVVVILPVNVADNVVHVIPSFE